MHQLIQHVTKRRGPNLKPQKLASVSLLKNLALMYDALEELKSTSEFHQLKNVTLAKAVHVIPRLISIFEGRIFGEGPKISEVKLAIENGIFQDVNISEGKSQPLIDQATFYQQLVKSFKSRIESVDEKHSLTQSTQCFEPYSWPRNEQNEIQISKEFSETLLKGLCNFLLDDFALKKQEFREFKGHFNGEEHVSASCDNIFGAT